MKPGVYIPGVTPLAHPTLVVEQCQRRHGGPPSGSPMGKAGSAYRRTMSHMLVSEHWPGCMQNEVMVLGNSPTAALADVGTVLCRPPPLFSVFLLGYSRLCDGNRRGGRP
jgi:hypothetical protein